MIEGGTSLLLAAFAVAKRVKARPGDVVAIIALLRECGAEAVDIGDISGFDAEGAAAFLGVGEDRVRAVVAALGDKGVVRDGRVTVASPGRRRAMTPAERTAAWRARKAARMAAVGRGDEGVTADVTASPRELFSLTSADHREDRKEQTKSRARDPRIKSGGEIGDGFAALKALWPVSSRMAEAEREYRRAVKSAHPADLLTLARAYLDQKPGWQSPLFLLNWLRTEPWRDPVLPLGAAPRVAAVGEAAVTLPVMPGVAHRLGEAGDRVCREVGATVFGRWLAALSVVRRDGGGVVLGAPSRFIRNWVSSHYEEPLRRAFGGRVEIVVTEERRSA